MMRVVLLTLLASTLLAACGDRPPAASPPAGAAAVLKPSPDSAMCRADAYAVGLYDRMMHPARLAPDEIYDVFDAVKVLDDPCKVDSLLAFAERFAGGEGYFGIGQLVALGEMDTLAAWVSARRSERSVDDWLTMANTMAHYGRREESLAGMLLTEAAPGRYTAEARSFMVEAFGEIGTLDEVLTFAERYEQGDGDGMSESERRLRRSYLLAFTRFDHPRLNSHVRAALAEPDLATFDQRFVIGDGVEPHRRHDLLPELRALALKIPAPIEIESRKVEALREAVGSAIEALAADSMARVPVGVLLSWPDTTATP